MIQQTDSLAYLFEEIGEENVFNELREAVKKNPDITVKEFLEKQDEEKLHHFDLQEN